MTPDVEELFASAQAVLEALARGYDPLPAARRCQFAIDRLKNARVAPAPPTT